MRIKESKRGEEDSRGEEGGGGEIYLRIYLPLALL